MRAPAGGGARQDRLRGPDTAQGARHDTGGVGAREGAEQGVRESSATGSVRQAECPQRAADAQALITNAGPSAMQLAPCSSSTCEFLIPVSSGYNISLENSHPILISLTDCCKTWTVALKQ